MKAWFIIIASPVFILGFIYQWIVTSFKVGTYLFRCSWDAED